MRKKVIIEQEKEENDVKICVYCGRKIPDKAIFCQYCQGQVEGRIKNSFVEKNKLIK